MQQVDSPKGCDQYAQPSSLCTYNGLQQTNKMSQPDTALRFEVYDKVSVFFIASSHLCSVISQMVIKCMEKERWISYSYERLYAEAGLYL